MANCSRYMNDWENLESQFLATALVVANFVFWSLVVAFLPSYHLTIFTIFIIMAIMVLTHQSHLSQVSGRQFLLLWSTAVAISVFLSMVVRLLTFPGLLVVSGFAL